MALSYLRSKKQLEELLVKRLGSLETLQGVLMKIENAANDIEVGVPANISNVPNTKFTIH